MVATSRQVRALGWRPWPQRDYECGNQDLTLQGVSSLSGDSFLKSLSRHFVLMLQISTRTYGFIRTTIPRTLLAVASTLLKPLNFL